MAANSKHRLDILAWIYKVIDSCENIQQAINAKKLARQYHERYPYKDHYSDEAIEYEVLIDHACRKVDKTIKIHCEKQTKTTK